MPSMTAARLNTSLSSLDLHSLKVPVPSATEVRIKVAYAGICLSDIHFITGETAAGMLQEVTLGHEVAGVIDQTGSDVTEWSVGDRVIAQPVENSDTSTRVLGVHYDGAWAEYVVVSAASLVEVPASVPLDVAAIIPDAVSTPWAAINDTAQVRPAESVAVWGLGGLGYHAVKLLRLVGAAPIIAVDPLGEARERALAAGADFALDPRADDFQAEIRRITEGRGIDVAFDFFGSPAIHQQAFDALGLRGRLVLVGIPEAPLHIEATNHLVRSAKRVLGHYGPSRRHLEELVKLVKLRRLDLSDSISAVYDLTDTHKAVDQLVAKTGHPVRILLKP
jgi:threonine dehydrogenase-like Zn-dependent dehydrogenase